MRLQRMYIHMYCSESKIIFKYNKGSWVPLYEHNIFNYLRLAPYPRCMVKLPGMVGYLHAVGSFLLFYRLTNYHYKYFVPVRQHANFKELN